jgi:Tol biopolymer transport system component
VAENLTAAVPISTVAPAAASMESGLFIAYEKSGNLWAWTGGAAVQITSSGVDSRPRLSADGKLVAFLRGSELWVAETSGQNPRRLYGEAGAIPLQFAFAPNSHRVYFTSASPDGTPQFDLNLADANSASVRSLLPTGQGGEFTFQPDGSRLALVQPDKIIVAHADGTDARVVYKFSAVKSQKRDYLPHIAWMENGSGFKTAIPGDPARFMFIMATGGQPAQLAEFRAVAPSVSDTYIAPDGSKLMYLKQQKGNLELHVIDASTTDKAYFAYARTKFGILGWTLDSQNILFWVEEPDQTWMNSGNDRAPLSDVTYASNVTWVNENSFLFLNKSELRLRIMGQPSRVLDTGVAGSFDAIQIP